ncbi:MAG: hypothetical protein WBQ94_21815 [Terracidiphilus sp.]
MRNFSLLLSIAFLTHAYSLSVNAQEPQPAIPACPSTATLDQLITAIDAAVSGPADKDRACFRALFAPDARLIPIRSGVDGATTLRVLTVDGWIDAVRKRGSQAFYERQVKVRSETWAHIAHLWSTYETRTTPDGKPPEGKVPEGKLLDRGINSIQAVYDGKQWHVLEIIWQAETPADPVPEKYLP